MRLLSVLCLSVAIQVCLCDIYFHNPRGSNNRLDEDSRNRNNARRMFDSQNNDRGGYNVGGMYYYAGSTLAVEWTNQHSCNDPNNHCNIVLQYMCGANVRDGATTRTIPDQPLECLNDNCNRDLRYGMNENFDYYTLCLMRTRNQGLFTADQRVRNSATRTRQNSNGQRYGYECAEERDYYPYWTPAPWIDIVVMTSRPEERCPYYRANSFNVQERYYCLVTSNFILENLGDEGVIPITEEECNELDLGNGVRGNWTAAPPLTGVAPDCIEALWSRDNHLGNGRIYPGYANYYNWTIPTNLEDEHCVLRIRYNISTGDYKDFDGADAGNNTRGNPLGLDVWSQVGLTEEVAEERGYVFENNPEVDLFDEFADGAGTEDFRLRLAINTAQFGRTFQDRSHVFSVRPAPSDIECLNGRIENLNVRGKRGNIVQVYPGVEYDFVPNRLTLPVGSCVHIQWTGSNTNPRNNDGQGLRGTDRSNMVLLGLGQNANLVRAPTPVGFGGSYGVWSSSYPQSIRNSRLLNVSMETADNLATLMSFQLRGEMSELDDAGTYFDLGLYKVTTAGIYYYLCTRNNNFTNRSQKGVIYVTSQSIDTMVVGSQGGGIVVADASLTVASDVFDTSRQIALIIWPDDLANAMLFTPNSLSISSFVEVSGIPSSSETRNITLDLFLNRDVSSSTAAVYIANSVTGFVFRQIDADIDGSTATVVANQDGVYAAYLLEAPVIVGAVVGFLLLLMLVPIALAVIYFLIYPSKLKSLIAKVKGKYNNTTRSFVKKV